VCPPSDRLEELGCELDDVEGVECGDRLREFFADGVDGPTRHQRV
jgi:hypothetical protein